mmetsp:Transcript_45855/g.108956  ORF Transcript_45855/g.108956 Transcript_45855/m.108956 type:complete len:215 (-) Transcript_45855:496-1140(-)
MVLSGSGTPGHGRECGARRLCHGQGLLPAEGGALPDGGGHEDAVLRRHRPRSVRRWALRRILQLACDLLRLSRGLGFAVPLCCLRGGGKLPRYRGAELPERYLPDSGPTFADLAPRREFHLRGLLLLHSQHQLPHGGGLRLSDPLLVILPLGLCGALWCGRLLRGEASSEQSPRHGKGCTDGDGLRRPYSPMPWPAPSRIPRVLPDGHGTAGLL